MRVEWYKGIYVINISTIYAIDQHVSLQKTIILLQVQLVVEQNKMQMSIKFINDDFTLGGSNK